MEKANVSNLFDFVDGGEGGAGNWSAVANSQLHHGTDVRVFIENQPLYRGNWLSGLPHLLQNNFDQNNFADTHSLILIVDSLAAQGHAKGQAGNDASWRHAA